VGDNGLLAAAEAADMDDLVDMAVMEATSHCELRH